MLCELDLVLTSLPFLPFPVSQNEAKTFVVPIIFSH